MKYLEEIQRASKFLGEKPDVVFVGQNTVYPGSTISKTFMDMVPREKRLELPVFEATQMGMSVGLALAGFVPVSIFGRPNFFLYALGQVINELDKFSHISHGKAHPKVIMKMMNGSVRPIDPGIQHRGDFSDAFKAFNLKNVEVVRLDEPEQVFPTYQKAYERDDGVSTIIVEWGDFYSEK